MAVPSVGNITVADPSDRGTWTSVICGGGTIAMPRVHEDGVGIDGGQCCSLSNGPTSLTAGDIASASKALGSSYDITGEQQGFIFHIGNSAGYNRVASLPDAIRIVLFSGVGLTEWGAWNQGGRSTPAYTESGTQRPVLITGTPDDSTASFDPADITSVGITIELGITGAYAFRYYPDQIIYIDGPILFQGGEIANPASMAAYESLMSATGGESYHSMINISTQFSYSLIAPISIESDYYRETKFPESLYSISMPGTDGHDRLVPAEGWYSLGVKTPALSDVVISNGLIAASERFDLSVDNGGDLAFSGTLVAGLRDVSFGGDPFSLSESTVIGNQSPVEVYSDILGRWTLKSSSNGGIKFSGGPGDYSNVECFIDESVSGNEVIIPDDVVGDYFLTGLSANHIVNIHNESATSAITVFVSSGLSYTTTTAGGVVTVSAPPVSVLITALDQITKAPIEGAAVYVEAGAAGGIAQGTEIANGLTDASGVLSVSLSISSTQSIQNSSVRKASSAPHYTAFPLDGTISTTSGLTITALMISEDS